MRLSIASGLALTVWAPAGLAQDADAQGDLKVPDDIEGDDELTPVEKKKRKEEAASEAKERGDDGERVREGRRCHSVMDRSATISADGNSIAHGGALEARTHSLVRRSVIGGLVLSSASGRAARRDDRRACRQGSSRRSPGDCVRDER